MRQDDSKYLSKWKLTILGCYNLDEISWCHQHQQHEIFGDSSTRNAIAFKSEIIEWSSTDYCRVSWEQGRNTEEGDSGSTVQDDQSIKCGNHCFQNAQHTSWVDRQPLQKRSCYQDHIISIKILHYSWVVHQHYANFIRTGKRIPLWKYSQQFLEVSQGKLWRELKLWLRDHQ